MTRDSELLYGVQLLTAPLTHHTSEAHTRALSTNTTRLAVQATLTPPAAVYVSLSVCLQPFCKVRVEAYSCRAQEKEQRFAHLLEGNQIDAYSLLRRLSPRSSAHASCSLSVVWFVLCVGYSWCRASYCVIFLPSSVCRQPVALRALCPLLCCPIF